MNFYRNGEFLNGAISLVKLRLENVFCPASKFPILNTTQILDEFLDGWMLHGSFKKLCAQISRYVLFRMS